MIQKIELFLFILSLIFTLRFLIEFILVLRNDNPSPMNVGKYNQVFLYLSTTYIITFLIINLF
jgi:hypothetical protein